METGLMTTSIWINNKFNRWHKSFEKYSSHLDDIDDVPLHTTDNFERFKKYLAKDKDVVGITRPIPMQDDDEKFEPYDMFGESLYTHPPDHNHILVDHRLDEDIIWSFGRSPYNQKMVTNTYTGNHDSNSAMWSHAPQWGQKMMMPHFFKEDMLPKFHRHWQHKLGLETLKLRLAISGSK